MAALWSFLAMCSLFVFVRSAVVAPRPSDCSATTLNGVLVAGQVTHPLYFCIWYLEDIRTRSPLLGLSPDTLTNACERISKCATAKDRAAAEAAISKASASTAAVSSQCPLKSANVITKEYFFPSMFCSFFNAYPRTTSPVPGQSVKAVFHACNCILGKTSTSATSSTSKMISTIKTSSSTSKSSVRTSLISTRKSAVTSLSLRSSTAPSSTSKKTSSSFKSSSTLESSSTSKASSTKAIPSTTPKFSSSLVRSSALKSSTITKVATSVTSSSSHLTSKSSSSLPLSSTKLSTSPSSLTIRTSSSSRSISASPSSPSLQTSSSKSSSSSKIQTTSTRSLSSATSTSVVDAYDVIISQGYQPFCSAYLSYTIPSTTVTATQTDVETTVQTNIATEISTSTYTSISTETDVSTITEYTTITTASPTSVVVVTKRAVETIPVLLSGYPDSSLSSACSKAATLPETVTISTTTTFTAIQTSLSGTTTTTVSVTTEVSQTIEPSLTTVTSISTSYTAPLPTQVVVNPSFEIGGTSGSTSRVSPWTYSGSAYTQSRVNNAFTSFDGDWFIVLYTPGATLSQALVGLAPGTTYTLQYYYRIFGASPYASTEVLTTTIGGQTVDTYSFTYMTPRMDQYVARSATYVATADTATLLFEVTGMNMGVFALDAITLTSTCKTECG